MNPAFRRLRFAIFLAFTLAARWTVAQTYEIFHAFGNAQGNPSGRLLRTADGALYGTTQTGGRYGLGSTFSLTPLYSGGYTFTELHAFGGQDGITPWAGLALAPDGSLWGTSLGGKNFRGNVFQMDRSGAVTSIYDFNLTDGYAPVGPLTPMPDGGFVGTTESGGANGNGTVFCISPSGALTTLHEFDGTDGGLPQGALLLSSDGFLYGTTPDGGLNALGTVFRVDLAGNFASLHSFDRSDGEGPTAGLVEGDDGLFYGTTPEDASGGGTVFRIDRSGNFATLYFFHGGPAYGPRET